jgi:hypothetical protein
VSRKGPIVAQFRYARFTLKDDNRDVALMERVDQPYVLPSANSEHWPTAKVGPLISWLPSSRATWTNPSAPSSGF